MILAVALLVLILWLGARRIIAVHSQPLIIYCAMWGLLVILFHSNLVTYDAVDVTTWMAIAVATLTFVIGSLTVLFASQPANRITRTRLGDKSLRRLKAIIVLIMIGGLLGFFMQARHLEEQIGIVTLLSDPLIAREQHSYLRYWGYLNLMNVISVPLAVIYIIHSRSFPLWFLFLIVISFASSTITTDRTRFFYTVIWSFYCGWYASPRAGITKGKILALVATVTTLLAFFLIIGKHFERSYADRFSENIHIPPSISFLTDPYIYLTGSIPALNALMADDNPRFMGKASFAPIARSLTLIKPDMELAPLQGKLYDVPMELNTYSYLQTFFHDFGWWGIILGPWICGMLTSGLFMLLVHRYGVFSILLAGLMGYCVTISVFVNMFSQEATWFFAALSFPIYWVIDRPEIRR